VELGSRVLLTTPYTKFCKVLVTLTKILSHTPNELTIEPKSRVGGDG